MLYLGLKKTLCAFLHFSFLQILDAAPVGTGSTSVTSSKFRAPPATASATTYEANGFHWLHHLQQRVQQANANANSLRSFGPFAGAGFGFSVSPPPLDGDAARGPEANAMASFHGFQQVSKAKDDICRTQHHQKAGVEIILVLFFFRKLSRTNTCITPKQWNLRRNYPSKTLLVTVIYSFSIHDISLHFFVDIFVWH